MGQPLTNRLLPEHLAKIRIDGRIPKPEVAEALNISLMHENTLPTIGGRLFYRGGFELMGHLAVKREGEIRRFLEANFLNLLDDEMQLELVLKMPAEERDNLRQKGMAEIPKLVQSAMVEIKQALKERGLRLGMHIQHWDNMRRAA